MKAEADDAKKKQKALSDKIRQIAKDKRAKERDLKKASTAKLEASKVVESDAEDFTPVMSTRSSKRKVRRTGNRKLRLRSRMTNPTPQFRVRLP